MDDSLREFRRWRTEHARNPNTSTTPLSEAADQAEHPLYNERLGAVGRAFLQDEGSSAADSLDSDDVLRDFGRQLDSAVDMDDIPSRFELSKQIAEDADDREEYLKQTVEAQKNRYCGIPRS